jgi:hypothetical protein
MYNYEVILMFIVCLQESVFGKFGGVVQNQVNPGSKDRSLKGDGVTGNFPSAAIHV